MGKIDIKTSNKCGDCIHGVEIEELSNMNYKEEYICVRCKFNPYYRMKSQLCCDEFKPKNI